jgi:hypothetical protein
MLNRNRQLRRDRQGRFARSHAVATATPNTPFPAPTLLPAAFDSPRAAFQAELEAHLARATAKAIRELTAFETYEGPHLIVTVRTPSSTARVSEMEEGIWEAVTSPHTVGAAPQLGGPFRTKAEARSWAERTALDVHVARTHERVIAAALDGLRAGSAHA